MHSRILVLLALVGTAWCDYQCVCNYLVEREVQSMPSKNSDLLGYLYEFDCKPWVTQDGGWYAVAYEHKLGYVQGGNRIQIQTCPGNYPDADKVTNISSPSSSSISNSTFPSSSDSYTNDAIVPSVDSTVQTAIISSSSSMPLSSPSSTSMSTTLVTQNALQACEQLTHQSSTAFAKDNFCYELVTNHQTFVNAERDCMRKGGHLVHIQSMEEQKFLTTNIQHYVGDSYIWIGLQDTGSEEHFEWTSGEPLSFTYWYPFRKDLLLHGFEDCVAMKTHNTLKVFDGEWDDLPCSRAHSYICQFDIQSELDIVG